MRLDGCRDRFRENELTFDIDPLGWRQIFRFRIFLYIALDHVQALLFAITERFGEPKGGDDRVVHHVLVVGSKPCFQQERASSLDELPQAIAGILLADQVPRAQ